MTRLSHGGLGPGAAVGLLVACSVFRPESSGAVATSAAPAPAPSSHDARGTTAQPSASTSAAAPDQTKGSGSPLQSRALTPTTRLRDVNLLHMTPAFIAVSSAVRNPRDFPEFLVDGRLDTAWQSQTGDLVGAWIAFRLPEDVRVKRIEMTAGYDRVAAGTDLFTANHRITRVAVSRDGRRLGEFALDPDRRGLQAIAVQGPGGEYRIVVKATKRGTRRQWREIAVSELVVVGDTGTTRRGPESPLRVIVGGLENSAWEDLEGFGVHAAPIDGRSYPTVRQLCAAFVRDARAKGTSSVSGAPAPGTPTCWARPDRYVLRRNPTYRRLLAIRKSDGAASWTQLVLQLPRGFVELPVYWKMRDPEDPGCPAIFRPSAVKTVRIENGHLVVVLKGTSGVYYADDGKPVDIEVRGAVWCMEAEGKLACRRWDPQYGGPLPPFAIAPDGSMRIQGRGLP